MPDPSDDPRLLGGAVWERPDGLRAVVVATPEGFVLATWPPSRGMMTEVLSSGHWSFPDRHALSDVLEGWRYVGFAGSNGCAIAEPDRVRAATDPPSH